MKKTMIGLVIGLLIFPLQVQATDLEFVGELTYNHFAIDRIIDGKVTDYYANPEYNERFQSQTDSGTGVYIGCLYSLTADWQLETGFDTAQSSYEGGCLGVDKRLNITADKKIVTENLYGPYLGVRYSVNQYLKLKSGLSYYFFYEDETFKYKGREVINFKSCKAEGIGGLVGAEVDYPVINDDFLFTVSVDYRFAKLEVVEANYQGELVDYNKENFDQDYKGKAEMEMSGLRLGTSITYRF